MEERLRLGAREPLVPCSPEFIWWWVVVRAGRQTHPAGVELCAGDRPARTAPGVPVPGLRAVNPLLVTARVSEV